MSSIAIDVDRISRIVGYVIQKGNFSTSSPNLPQSIAIFAEANDANQGTLSTLPQQITSAKQAGDTFGYGSPIHMIMRILRPVSGDLVGGIPTIVYPQAKAGGATPMINQITPAGVASGNGTHYLVIAGREGVDGVNYAINIASGDTVAIINHKIANAVNAVLGSPVICVSTDYTSVLTSKWSGLTANGISIKIDNGGNSLGLTYVITTTGSGSGIPSVSASLALFGNVWNTIVINSYGTDSTTMSAFEAFNGIPLTAPSSPTGRYAGTVFKPFIALTGSIADDPSAITDARPNDVTIAICPAPGSAGLALEAAANMCALYGPQAQNSPHLDVAGQFYPDQPTPSSIGSMSDYNNRDLFVKKGCSTVDLVSGQYQVQDFVTTYHPSGEVPPQYRYCRNLNLDFNVRYGYLLLELINVVDHAIANDNDTVTATEVVKPKQWLGILDTYADDLVSRGLTVDAPFMQNSIEVSISTVNPDRFETFFRYKRSGFVRQSATTAEAGFNFGTLN